MPFWMSAVQSETLKTGDISATLLKYYQANARTLPWRLPPGETKSPPDPYHVWLSEIMLQQTTVAAVIPYFQKFTARWPDFKTLAGAKDAEVMAAWAGLGYYARARNLIACARKIVADLEGHLPDNEVELLQLPGIGPYTAAAISAIAFGRRAVVVDANIERVVARLFTVSAPLPAAKSLIRAATDTITPQDRSGDFAQAMMDLGASLCSARAPRCDICPLAMHCAAYRAGNPEAYPRKAAKKEKPVRTGTAYWIERGGNIWLLTRSDTGMLGGMRALPDDRWRAGADGDSVPPFAADWRILDTQVHHVFTHFTLSLNIAVTAGPAACDMATQGEYWPVNSLDKAGLPTLFNKVVKAVTAEIKISRRE
jgi:A/G-specific adenine glycosylase